MHCIAATRTIAFTLSFTLVVTLPLNAACSPEFNIKLIKDPASLDKLSSAVVRTDKANSLVKDQVIIIQDGANSFVVAPVISTSDKFGGCYLHTGTPQFALNKSLQVAANDDTTTCDAVVAIFACRSNKGNALGLIYGLRLGGQNYYTEGSVYMVSAGVLEEDVVLSKKIDMNTSAADAKKKLGCSK